MQVEKGGDVTKEYIIDSIYNLNHAIKKSLEVCYIGYEETDDDITELWVQKKDWSYYIDLLIESAIHLEEYELCSELKEIKQKLI